MPGDTVHIDYCSFCGKSQIEVDVLVAGPVAFICDECVELCRPIIEQRRAALARHDTKDDGGLGVE